MVWDNGIQVAFCARLRIGIMSLRGVAEGAHREVRPRAVEDSRGHPFIFYGQGSIQRPCLRDRLQFFARLPLTYRALLERRRDGMWSRMSVEWR